MPKNLMDRLTDVIAEAVENKSRYCHTQECVRNAIENFEDRELVIVQFRAVKRDALIGHFALRKRESV